MTPNFITKLPKLALAALFAVTAGGSVIASQATHPSTTASANDIFADTSAPASAGIFIRDRFPGGYVDVGFRGGYNQGRYWQHRRWHAGYWGPYHRWHPGYWVYF